VTRERSDRDGLRLQVYASRELLTGRERWVSHPMLGKGRAALKRARQVKPELIIRVAAGHHRSSRTKVVAELIERRFEGCQSVRPISPTTIAAYRGDIDCCICRTPTRSRSASWSRDPGHLLRPPAPARRWGCPARLFPADRKSEPRRWRLATAFGLRHVPGGVGSIGHCIHPELTVEAFLWLHHGGPFLRISGEGPSVLRVRS
jgi:hypothetical protein